MGDLGFTGKPVKVGIVEGGVEDRKSHVCRKSAEQILQRIANYCQAINETQLNDTFSLAFSLAER